MGQFTVRVINLKARREHRSFLEIANNLWVAAENKQQARKLIHKQLTEQGLVYGRDFVLGCVGKYTGKGVTVGFSDDVFQNTLPHHTFIAYDWFNDKEKKIYGFNKVSKDFCMMACPQNLDAEQYVVENGEFVCKLPD